jgi:hypothetical protein
MDVLVVVDISGMIWVSHGIFTKTFDVVDRNSSILNTPPNIWSAILFGAARIGAYLFPLACFLMSDRSDWISPDLAPPLSIA